MNLVIVVPCYNEEEVLPETSRQLHAIIEELRLGRKITAGRILYVDDGSRDKTWSLIESLSTEYPEISGLKLAHNVGHQQALWAGMEWAAVHADAIVSIDADLQDDVRAIISMVDGYHQGMDIVYGVRRERNKDTFFKKYTALFFYRFMQFLGGDIVYNHADFRLMSQRALQALMSFPERNLFLRGLVCSLGFPSSVVYYDRQERFAGESKYPFSKMLSFALDGITSFSVKPLRYIVVLGILFILVSLAVIIYGVIIYMDGKAIQGWTSLLVSIWFIGGCILTSIGIIGEYVGKLYKEVKRRPRYFIEKEVNLF